jgi:hypothetical protein
MIAVRRFTMSTSKAEAAAIRPYPQPPIELSEPSGGSLYALLLRQIKATGLLEYRLSAKVTSGPRRGGGGATW